MILRMLRGRAPADRALDVSEALSGAFLDSARAFSGLTSYAAGLRLDADATRFLISTTWESIADLTRETGGALDQAARPLLPYMAVEGVEHLELVGEPVPILLAPPQGVVRVATMAIRTGAEEEFYAVVRRGIADLQPKGNLVAYHLGRRVEAGRHMACAVSAWRNSRALGELVRPETGEPLWADELAPLIEEFEVEHFDAVIVRPA